MITPALQKEIKAFQNSSETISYLAPKTWQLTSKDTQPFNQACRFFMFCDFLMDTSY